MFFCLLEEEQKNTTGVLLFFFKQEEEQEWFVQEETSKQKHQTFVSENNYITTNKDLFAWNSTTGAVPRTRNQDSFEERREPEEEPGTTLLYSCELFLVF